MASIKDIATRIFSRIADMPRVEGDVDDLGKAIPGSAFTERGSTTDNAEAVGIFIDQIFEDGVNFFRDAFMRHKDSRFTAYTTPKAFWEACLKLEGGDHWEVWGHRRSSEKDWKQELVDDEIGDQNRARAAYLTANWHDIEIMPNIAHLNEILDHERKATDWSRRQRMTAKYMMTFGMAVQRSVFDKSENANGYATEFLCRPGTVARTPFSTSFKKVDGCWYSVHMETVNQAWIRENLPDFPLEDVKPSGSYDPKKVMVYQDTEQPTEYAWTKLYVKKEAYFDDPKTVKIPFEQEEFDGRLSLLLQGEKVQPELGDNHDLWIEAYRNWAEEMLATVERTDALEPITNPKELEQLQASFNLIDDQIEQHIKLRDSYKAATGLKPGREKKYPHGRYVVTIENVPAVDVANPYEMDWRRLFHEIKNEDVPERIDGRSDVEILWNRNKTMDTAISRFGDNAILNAYQKPWIREADKAVMDKNGGWNDDPTIPGVYSESPPQYPRVSTQGAELYLNLYGRFKDMSATAKGVSGVTYGQSPTKQSSAELAQTLLQQNEIQVTGEANQNLSDAIEGIIETRIEMWRKFYTFPRIYTIDGGQHAIILSQILNNYPVWVGDQQVPMPITEFQVRVRPGSNFPNKFEKDLQLMLMLLNARDPLTGLSLVPREMVMDLLGSRFPSLSQNGRYRQMDPIIQAGMQAIQQQQAAQEQEKETLGDIAKKRAEREKSEYIKRTSKQPTNGESA